MNMSQIERNGGLTFKLNYLPIAYVTRFPAASEPLGFQFDLWRREIDNGTIRLPQELPLNFAAKNLVIVAVDQDFFEARREWEPYVSCLVKSATTGAISFFQFRFTPMRPDFRRLFRM